MVYQSIRRPSVRVSTFSNMNINGSIATIFYLTHDWVWGKAELGFGPDRIRTLVSMATESSHKVLMEITVSPLFPILFILAVNEHMHRSSAEFVFLFMRFHFPSKHDFSLFRPKSKSRSKRNISIRYVSK